MPSYTRQRRVHEQLRARRHESNAMISAYRCTRCMDATRALQRLARYDRDEGRFPFPPIRFVSLGANPSRTRSKTCVAKRSVVGSWPESMR